LGSDLETDNETIFAASQQIFNKQIYEPLLVDAFVDRHVPMEMTGTKMEELCVLHGPS
jgi:hypothetical protein